MTRLWPSGEAIDVWGKEVDLEGFVWQGTPHRVRQVCNTWRIHTFWWDPHALVQREYVKVITESGLLCQIYRDLISGTWYLSRLYD
ncbi:MAG: hypothetical protein JXA09_15765 [Anaerolineae bacterium]|nr:hypothetical protein [Anaerolineae bacterium]